MRVRGNTSLRVPNRCNQQKDYLSPLHLSLHAADAVVHCATHDPDSPQFCAQEKLMELQLAMHSENVRFCASQSRSVNVAALPDIDPNKSDKSTATYLMV
jgi:hypothetical protein